MDGDEIEIDAGSVPGVLRRAAENSFQHLLLLGDKIYDVLTGEIRIPERMSAEDAKGNKGK